MSDFLMGNVASYNAGTTGIMAKRGTYIGAYVADTWKVNQKVTFNYGLAGNLTSPWFHLAVGRYITTRPR